MAKLNLQPAYSEKHSGCPDLDGIIFCKVMELGGMSRGRKAKYNNNVVVNNL
jgi:hypothetical protein